jgi:hypothetical protein
MPSSRARYEEHQFSKVIPGDIEAVRKLISDVIEDFGYALLGSNPIQAKRRRQRNLFTATVLECQTQLTIALKPISDVSTLATFDYGVEYLFTKGDRRTLEREADAIIAVATTPASTTLCSACGTENDGGVRFCRVCGTPVARQALLPELELMQMSARTSAAHLEITLGLVFELLTLASALPLILFGPRGIVQLGWGFFAFGELLVTLILLQGIRRLHSAVVPAPSEPHGQEGMPRAIPTEARASLPPQQFSVTEGTTELMNSAEAPISVRPAKTTDSI